MKKSQLILFISCITLVFCAFAKSLKVYKHVDKDGIIHYSSKKPTGKSYRILNIKCPECSQWRNSVNWYSTPLITDKFSAEINQAAKKWKVDKALIQAIIHAESAFKEWANSSAGAQGLMQLMPSTQATYKVNDPYNPRQNINAGTAYFKHLQNTYNDLDISLAAYNSGETAVEKYGKTVPPYPETKEYVRRVKILMKRYKNKKS